MEKELTQQLKRRIPKNRRIKEVPRLIIRERDKEIILEVLRSRFLRRDQIERLFFTSTVACNRRLKMLYQHGFLERIYQPVSFGLTQACYALDREGARLVAKELNVEKPSLIWKKKDNKVGFLFLEHTLTINEFKVNLVLAERKEKSFKLLFFKPEWEDLKDKVSDPKKEKKYLPVNPDAFFGIETEKGRSYFFLEADLGTETTRRFRQKIVSYRQYWKEGKYQKRYGFKSFRVLTVTTNEKRLLNLLVSAQKEGAKSMFLFTAKKFVTPKLLSTPIWLSPSEKNPIPLT